MAHFHRTAALAAIVCALPIAAAAQMTGPPAQPATPPVNPPAATTQAPSANTGAAANTNAALPALSSGLAVKDNTGATIGQIASLQTDASGKQMATIKMGSDTFNVDAANL